jgi:Protein of unknown function (DUF1579)
MAIRIASNYDMFCRILPLSWSNLASATGNRSGTLEKTMNHFPPQNTDFDFLHGSWTITIRRRRCLFQGCEDWEGFFATSRVEPILGGSGHIEHINGKFPDGSPLHGLNFRLYNPRIDRWVCHWSDSLSHMLHPSTEGQFRNGIALFEGSTQSGQKTISIRSRWTSITADSATWSQEMSMDGGKTWESNWVMEYLADSTNHPRLQPDFVRIGPNRAMELGGFHPN